MYTTICGLNREEGAPLRCAAILRANAPCFPGTLPPWSLPLKPTCRRTRRDRRYLSDERRAICSMSFPVMNSRRFEVYPIEVIFFTHWVQKSGSLEPQNLCLCGFHPLGQP